MNFPIDGSGPLCGMARRTGYLTFAQVAEAIRALPYGRTSNLRDVAAVIKEGKGTCSSKHRFLAALAHECGHHDIQLVIGLYEMSAQNTLGVADVLASEHLRCLPEAHCYLVRGTERFDFTGLALSASSPFDTLMGEHSVSPSELPAAKTAYQRKAIQTWARRSGLDPDRAWAIRERCIAALAGSAS